MRYRFGALALVMLLALAVSGCRRAGSEPEAFVWTEHLAPGSVLHVRTGTGGITVTAVPGTTARVTANRVWHKGRSRDINFQVTRAGDRNDVYVCAMWRASGRCAGSGYRGKRVDTFLSFFSLLHRTTDASSSFNVELPEGVTIDAWTTNGAVSVAGVRAGVNARTVNGSVAAIDVAGRLNLSTTSGNVRVRVATLDGVDTIRATTVHGTVQAELPENTQGEFDVTANNGAVHSEFPIAAVTGRREHFTGRIGDAARFVRLRTLKGSVSLVKTTATEALPAVAPAAVMPSIPK